MLHTTISSLFCAPKVLISDVDPRAAQNGVPTCHLFLPLWPCYYRDRGDAQRGSCKLYCPRAVSRRRAPPNRTRKQRKSPADAALGLTSSSLRIYKLPKPAMFKDSHTTPTKTAPGQRRTDFAPCLLPYLVLSANLQAPRAYINLGLTPKASPQGQGRTDYAPSIASRGALINVNCFLRDLLFAL